MRTIKTREAVRNIKVLDKTVDLSKRMKNSFIRTKSSAVEVQQPHSASPTDDAIGKVQEKSQGVVRETVHHLPKPRMRALKRSIGNEKVKVDSREVSWQPAVKPQSQSFAQKQGSVVKTRGFVDKTKAASKIDKGAVNDTMQSYKQMRWSGLKKNTRTWMG